MPEDVTDRRSCHKCHKTVTGKRKLSKCSICHSITYCGQECQKKDWTRHSQFCIPVMVTEIPGKGKGLVASKDFKKGQVLFQDTAAITIHAPCDIIPLKELKEQVSNMSEEQKTKFYQLTPKGCLNPAQLADAFRENCLQELDIFYSNCLDEETGAADKRLLFVSSSFLNHSCSPNVLLEGNNENSDSFHEVNIIAIKDISKGEEVTECYKKGFMTSSEMKTMLHEDFLFDCKCGVCAGSIPNQDRIILEISSKFAIAVSRSLDLNLRYQMKAKQWITEASQLERAADLTKQLYIGHFSDRLKVYILFVFASHMARDSIRLKKAMDLMKEEVRAVVRVGELYKTLETKVERWSKEQESRSKRKPTQEEIDDFHDLFV